jgi:hypothetical protein
MVSHTAQGPPLHGTISADYLWALSPRATVTFFDPSVLSLPRVHFQTGRASHGYGNIAQRIKQYGFGAQSCWNGFSGDWATDHDIWHYAIFFA